jgi:hypothetical protein
MKAIIGVALALLWTSIAFAQQVASVDLTRPPVLTTPTEKTQETALRNGCEKLTLGIISDGLVEPEDHQPHQIVVEVSHAEDMKPAAGSDLRAEVKLRNTGKQAIQIPWSTDASIVENGQNPDDLVWDEGTFEFALRNQSDDQVRLKSLARPLFGSKFSPGSLLTVQPGAWITAVIKFKLKDEYGIHDGALKAGRWQLSAEWHQSERKRRLDGCRVTTGYFTYGHYFQQQNPSVDIQITQVGSTTSAEPRP